MLICIQDNKMNLEIEKKFSVPDFKITLEKLKNDFGNFTLTRKDGFWWCNNYNSLNKILSVEKPLINKKDVIIIKNIGEFYLPDDNYDYIRLRINEKKLRKITFKNKSMVNNTEQNLEYEFDVDDEKFKKISSYLKEKALIFYCNTKETWEFQKNDIKVQLSKISDLKDSYIEIETTGNTEKTLHDKLNKFLTMITDYKLKEEIKNYVELYFHENNEKLKALTLGQYSREAYKMLEKYLNSMNV